MLTTTDVARQVHVSPKTIAGWCRRGELPAYHFTPRGRWFVDPAELQRWAAEHVKTAA